MNTESRILLTGGHGFLGQNIYKELTRKGYKHVIVPTHSMFDLRDPEQVNNLMRWNPVDVIIHCAAHCGGIGLNKAKPADLFYDNMAMGLNLIHGAVRFGVKKFVQLGTVCEYPKHTPTPFVETNLWNGYPEETNAPYGIAKRALLVMGNAYRQQWGLNSIHILPVNLYGPGDNFNDDSSHVIPALIKKLLMAKIAGKDEVVLWGSGNAFREFLYVDDAARGIVLAAEKYDSPEPINLGIGQTISIRALAELIASKMKFTGRLVFDTTQPDGQPLRCLDVTRATEFGFFAETDLSTGLDNTIAWYRDCDDEAV